MEFRFVKNIYRLLANGIDENYESGVNDVLKKTQKKFDSGFKVNYSARDKLALKYFKIEVFTVAHVGEYELQEKLKELAIKIWQEDGQDFGAFEEEARRIMLQYVPLEEQLPTGWLETNYNTAVNSSYKAAEYNTLRRPEIRNVYDAYQYMTQDDDAVREEHQVLHEKIYPADDPVWDVIWPPNGWNCRCYVTPLSPEEYDDGDVEDPTDEQRHEAYKTVDENFRRNPGQSQSIYGKWLKSQLSGMPKDIVNQIKQNVGEFAKTL